MKNFDIAFIGSGVASVFALQRMHEKQFSGNAVIFDSGRPPLKRKHQILGWLGCAAGSDGKLYMENEGLEKLLGPITHKKYRKNVLSYLDDKSIIEKVITSSVSKKFQKNIDKYNYQHTLYSYYQLIPKNMHTLSKIISDEIIDSKHMLFKFDEHVHNIEFKDNQYEIKTDYGNYTAKQLVLATGRSGWMSAYKFLDRLGLVQENRYFQCGIKIETSEDNIAPKTGLSKPVFSLKKDDIEVGPFLWSGTMVPEDQFDFTVANFRSNEGRWVSNNVHFNLFKTIDTLTDPTCTNESATKEVDRIAKLTSILSNERVVRENLKTIMAGKSKLSVLPTYGASKNGGWLVDACNDLANLFPNLLETSKAYIPSINPYGTFKVKLNKRFQASDSLYIIGEATGISGILQAAVMGNCFADKNF